MKFLILTTTLLFATLAQALEPQDPKSLCDRFMGRDQESCERRVSELKPDWYLAAVCNRQFDDNLFYECLGLSQKSSFSPLGLEPCEANELNDMDRMKCIESAKTTVAKSYQPDQVTGRNPASLPKKRK